MSDSDAIIHIENLSYQYPGSSRLALRDINLQVRRGELLGIVGPTGAGKTTLCLALNGIVPQFYGGRFFGRAQVAGLDTIETATHVLARHVAMVFEDPETQLVTNSVLDELAFPLENTSIAREEIMRRIPWALQAVRLDGKEAKHPSELSGGEKQRLAIAAALATQPKVLVLDEPTSQLDPVGSQEVFSTVRELNARLGITVVLVSHASEELAEFADRVALLAGGELVAVGPPSRVLADVSLLGRYAIRPPHVATLFGTLAAQGVKLARTPVTLQQASDDLAVMRPRLCIGAFDPRAANHPGTVEQPQAETKTAGARGSRLPSRHVHALSSAPRPLLSAHEASYAYPDGTQALQRVSLDVHAGEYVMICGQNGAGKTTLVKQFLHLLEPTAGEINFDGADVRGMTVSQIAQRIGFVSQNPDNQIFTSSVEGEVAFALHHLGMAPREVEARVEESLAAMGLSAHKKTHPLALPKGDRARVVTAAVLAMHPDILIFDEPTTGQDYAGAMRILDVSRELHRAGKTVIVVTHHLYLMPGFAERAVVMGKGTVLLDAPLRQVYHSSKILRQTSLAPPQIVQFAQRIQAAEGVPLPILTPEELAGCIHVREKGT